MASTKRTYYFAPSVTRERDEHDPAITVPATEFGIVLGSDLILATDGQDITAFDSDSNPLAVLAVLARGVSVTDVLPHVIATAKALFPNHLLTEI